MGAGTGSLFPSVCCSFSFFHSSCCLLCKLTFFFAPVCRSWQPSLALISSGLVRLLLAWPHKPSHNGGRGPLGKKGKDTLSWISMCRVAGVSAEYLSTSSKESWECNLVGGWDWVEGGGGDGDGGIYIANL